MFNKDRRHLSHSTLGTPAHFVLFVNLWACGSEVAGSVGMLQLTILHTMPVYRWIVNTAQGRHIKRGA